jgi:hypothetical protein
MFRSLAFLSALVWAGLAQAADGPGYVMDSAAAEMSTACSDQYVSSSATEPSGPRQFCV